MWDKLQRFWMIDLNMADPINSGMFWAFIIAVAISVIVSYFVIW